MMFLFTFFHFSSGFMLQTTEQLSAFPLRAAPKKAAKVKTPKVKGRFLMMAVNAAHPLTTRMRAIKEELVLPTAQLVQEFNAYEKAHQSHNFRRRDGSDVPAWRPINSVYLSSYLQGAVVQPAYMELMCQRLENFLAFKRETAPARAKAVEGDIRTIMRGWYVKLGITPKGSASRLLSSMVAPYYKRASLAPMTGYLRRDRTEGDLQYFTITALSGEEHSFSLPACDPLLVPDGVKVEAGTPIQFSQFIKNKEGKVVRGPGVDHSTLYRWWTSGNMPRSINTIEVMNAAVEAAALEQSKLAA